MGELIRGEASLVMISHRSFLTSMLLRSCTPDLMLAFSFGLLWRASAMLLPVFPFRLYVMMCTWYGSQTIRMNIFTTTANMRMA